MVYGRLSPMSLGLGPKEVALVAVEEENESSNYECKPNTNCDAESDADSDAYSRFPRITWSMIGCV